MKFPYNLRQSLYMLVCLAFVAMDLLTMDGRIPWGAMFFGLCLLVFVFSARLEKFHDKRLKALCEFVECDEERIRRVIPSQIEETIRWKDIAEIAIVTSDKGPFEDDVHWLISNQDKSTGVGFSNDALGPQPPSSYRSVYTSRLNEFWAALCPGCVKTLDHHLV